MPSFCSRFCGILCAERRRCPDSSKDILTRKRSHARSELKALIDEHIHHWLDREILSLLLLDERTYEYIAEALDRSVNCIKSRAAKALQQLSQYL